jgi:transposase-like protein
VEPSAGAKGNASQQNALRVKIRDEGLVKNKAVYVALALNPDGEKDVLGLWIKQTEGAKFWLKVFNDLKARGVNDILIAVVDGLKGFPEAIGNTTHRGRPDRAWVATPNVTTWVAARSGVGQARTTDEAGRSSNETALAKT